MLSKRNTRNFIGLGGLAFIAAISISKGIFGEEKYNRQSELGRVQSGARIISENTASLDNIVNNTKIKNIIKSQDGNELAYKLLIKELEVLVAEEDKKMQAYPKDLIDSGQVPYDYFYSRLPEKWTNLQRRIIAYALSDNQKIPSNIKEGENYPEWRYLKEIHFLGTRGFFKENGKYDPPGEVFSDEQYIGHLQPHLVRPDGKIVLRHWCGMWTAYMWQKAGLKVYWKSYSDDKPGGGIFGEMAYKNLDKNYENAQPGDVVVGYGISGHMCIIIEPIRNKEGKIEQFLTINANGTIPGIYLRYVPVSKMEYLMVPNP